METSRKNNLIACSGCGLVQDQPETPPDPAAQWELACARCGHTFLDQDQKRRSLAWTRAFSFGALILLPPALLMEMVQIEQLGHAHGSSVLGAIVDLLKNGQIPLGIMLMICSIIFPLAKLIGLLALTGGMIQRWQGEHKKRVWQWIEWTGRFGMLDVLLVTLFVAFVKLGDLVTINVGPGLYLFAASVIMNLLAALCFDPHSIWSDEL